MEKQEENKNEQNTGTKTVKKIGKVTYEVVVHFNENATETMQDKLKTIGKQQKEHNPYKARVNIFKNTIYSIIILT